MKDERKTKKELIAELNDLRRRVVRPEEGEAGSGAAEGAYRALVEQSLQGLIIVQDYRFVFANEAAASMVGYDVAELLNLPADKVRAIVHPDDQELVWGQFAARLKGKPVPPRYECRAVRKDKSVVWLEMFASAIDYGGRPAVQAALLDISEQKQAQEALRSNQAVLSSVLSSIDDLVFVLDEHGVFLDYLGPAGGPLYLPPEEFLGRPVGEVLPPAVADPVLEAVAALKRGGAVQLVDYSLEVDGEERQWGAKISARQDSEGRFAGVTAVVREITERKRAEAALRESEERFRTIVETAPSMLTITDAEGNNVYVSPQCEQMLGCRSQDLEETFSWWAHEDDLARARDVFERSFKEQQGEKDFEYKAVRRDGEVWHASSSWELLRDKDGHFAGFVLQTRDITERKRAEQALRESEERFRLFFENSPEYCYMQSPDGVILDVNRAALEALGYTKSELVGQGLTVLYARESLTKAEELFAQCGEAGHIENEEVVIEAKQGDRRTVLLSAAVVRDEAGRIRHSVSVQRDITERKQAQEDLEVRVRQLSALARGSVAVTASLELEGLLAEIVSLATDVVGADSASVVLVDDSGRPAESVDTVPGVLSIQYRIRENGLTSWIADRRRPVVVAEIDEHGGMSPPLGRGAPRQANPYLVGAGVRSLAGLPLVAKEKLLGILYLHSCQPGAFAGQMEVLTAFASQAAVAVENARLYAALQRSQRLLERTIASLRDAVFVIDGETVEIVDCNPAASEVFGYVREEILGRTTDFLHVDSHALERFRSLLYPAIEEKGFLFLPEFEMKRKDGEVFPSEHSVVPLADAEGRSTGWVSVVRDITRRKSMEEQMRHQERLAAVGQLAGGIAHDFNNYLSTIMLYAGLVSRTEGLPGEAAHNAKVIIDESQRAAGLVQQVLDFSRRSVMDIQRLDMVTFVQAEAGILRRALPENIALVVDGGSGTWAADADPARIQQVLTNLVLNARDAMPGGGELRITLSNVAVREGDEPPDVGLGAGDWVCLSVSDSGTGIPPDVLPHIYEPFFTTKGPGLGVGLGLPQVYGIIVQHGGHIGVETAVGKGTTFRVHLPAHKARGLAKAKSDAQAPPRGKGERILLVEDNEGVRDAAAQALESLGYELLQAADGREALEIYRRQERVDLVLTDIVMPELGGAELVRELKRVDPEVRVVAMTGYAPDGGREHLEEAGVAGVLRKPLEVVALAQTIRRALDGD
jgi:two-component system cell cycle sensor histidine kinase/response regulator CckA